MQRRMFGERVMDSAIAVLLNPLYAAHRRDTLVCPGSKEVRNELSPSGDSPYPRTVTGSFHLYYDVA